ncbi:MAG: hypothetical protein JSV86_07295 [Gemmatimonadota bacterium]|nr:MAG: hypothetical protein JSV86_07295 [Gemmatimonadota bacterium]
MTDFDRAAFAAFLVSGNATFTATNTQTGNRFTYRVRQKDTLYFVAVLTGPDNIADYTFLGTIFPPRSAGSDPLRGLAYYHGKRSSISPDAQSARAFEWLFRWRYTLPEFIEIDPMGRCGRCGRSLTTPESVRTGLGPICAGRQ